MFGPVSADTGDLADKLGAALGGRVEAIRRVSGGASRVTSTFDLEMATGKVRSLVLQQVRGTDLARRPDVEVEAALLRAAREIGVPVPEVVAAGGSDRLEPGWLVVEHLEGETIPRHILRNDEFAAARTALTEQTARALAAIHAIDPERVPGLPPTDPLGHPLDFLDALHQRRPVLELGARWLALARPAGGESAVVHGDFRMGNFLVDGDGLSGVLDWELAHRGQPAEDIGWLCSKTWRFGGPARVGGFGELDRFLDAYTSAGGRGVDVDDVRWWEVYAAVKWAVICLLQATTHLSGSSRSVELAAIGRRVCESEWNVLDLLGVAMPEVGGPVSEGVEKRELASETQLFGLPSAADLLEAVGEYIETKVMTSTEGAARFEARVARNVLAMVGRELLRGPAALAAHAERLRNFGVPDDATLAAAIRAGHYDDDLVGAGAVLAPGVRDQLLVVNPSYLRDPTVPGIARQPLEPGRGRRQ